MTGTTKRSRMGGNRAVTVRQVRIERSWNRVLAVINFNAVPMSIELDCIKRNKLFCGLQAIVLRKAESTLSGGVCQDVYVIFNGKKPVLWFEADEELY